MWRTTGGLLATAAGVGCRPQGVWGARTTLCTRGAVQDGRVPCQDSKGMTDVAGKINFPVEHVPQASLAEDVVRCGVSMLRNPGSSHT